MTMATESTPRQDSRGKGAVLCKQSEIEETDEHEQDTSPGSDQSDATITAGGKLISTNRMQLLKHGISPFSPVRFNYLRNCY